MADEFSFGSWVVAYSGSDGGRIEKISYGNQDLLTGKPASFTPPTENLGQYETRPVFGYDDCCPSVVACDFPKSTMGIPDHGELCWLSWDAYAMQNSLSFVVKSKQLPFLFKRELLFEDTCLKWNFSIYNDGFSIIPFQHVMHPLLPVNEITGMELPEFRAAFDFDTKTVLPCTDGKSIEKYLLDKPVGTTAMLFLQDITEGKMSWTYKSGMKIAATFPQKLFSSIGIWWNNLGHPVRDNCARGECAFEPTPGDISSLAHAYEKGNCLFVPPRRLFSWQVVWDVN